MEDKNFMRITPCGRIIGTTCQWPGVESYRGIRYARAGRFEYPVEVTGWEGNYDATSYGHCCYQPRAFYDEAKMQEKVFYYREFRKGETYTYSEDCLFLNIWTPEGTKPGAKLPVILYIHGGGYTGGCGHEKHFDGPVWPKYGVVAVTINYRLGPLGFAALPELKEEAGFTGNYGLVDQYTALLFIRHNIAAYGGDPDNITLMGQSAGAMSVQQLILSPLTKGMIAKAVMSSGAGVSKMMPSVPAEKNYEFWHLVMEKAGVSSLTAFRTLTPEKLFEAWTMVKKENPKVMMGGCLPCIDGKIVVGSGTELVKDGKMPHIPYITGINSEDIMPLMLYEMAYGWSHIQAEAGYENSYTYFFDRQLPGDKNGAWHSADLWYWFGTLDHCWRPMEGKDYALSQQMVRYLISFAKNGNPNTTDPAYQAVLPKWLPITKKQAKVLRIGEKETEMGSVSKVKLTQTMLTHKVVGE